MLAMLHDGFRFIALAGERLSLGEPNRKFVNPRAKGGLLRLLLLALLTLHN